MKGTVWIWNLYEGHRYDPACCLYRIYDPETHDLLYVGQTCVSLRGRVQSHCKSKQWFMWDWRHALVTYEEFVSWDQTIIAEAEAIRDENPRYNVDRPDPDALRSWYGAGEVA